MIRKPSQQETNPLGPYPELPAGEAANPVSNVLKDWWYLFQRVLARRDEQLSSIHTILSGTVDPSPGVGNDGDFYINTATVTLFGPKAGGVWPAGIPLRGTNGLGLTAAEILIAKQGFTLTVTVPAATWFVNHNLGYRPSAITVWTQHEGQDKLTDAEVVYINDNTFQVRHSVPKTGMVRAS